MERHQDVGRETLTIAQIAHYADLIAAGQDCTGEPTGDPDALDRQRSRT